MISRWLDTVFAVLLFAGSLAEIYAVSPAASGFRGPAAVSVAAAAAYAGCVLFRSRASLASAVVLALAFLVWLLPMYRHAPQPPFEPALAAMLVLYAVGARLPLIRAAAGAGVLALALAVADGAALLAGRSIGDVAPAWLFFIASFALGRLVRSRQLAADESRARAERAEADREARARDAVEAERARIARELHDVVTHAVSGMVLQAAAERRSLPQSMIQTRAVLADVENSGRDALVGLRHLLGVLRRTDEVPLAPLPSLADVDDLLGRSCLPVRLEVSGSPCDLPGGVHLAAYRSVQEGLTNVRKHGRDVTEVLVSVRYLPDRLEIEVRDDGRLVRTPPAPGAADAGFGLLGLRERVLTLRGELSAGPDPSGGFRLLTVLPLSPP